MSINVETWIIFNIFIFVIFAGSIILNTKWRRDYKKKSANTVHMIMEGLSNVLYEKSYYFNKHCYRVGLICNVICDALDINGKEKEEIVMAAQIHDIGKINVNLDLLETTKTLSKRDWRLIKNHTHIGFRMLSKFEISEIIKSYVLYHHENWDGSGYPLQLIQKSIPLGARIIRVADSIDAMAIGRPYKEAMPFNVIEQELKKHANRQFDPNIIKIISNLSKRIKLIIINNRASRENVI